MRQVGINKVSSQNIKDLGIGTKIELYSGDRVIIVRKLSKHFSYKDICGFVIVSLSTGVSCGVLISEVKSWEENYDSLNPFVIDYWKRFGEIHVILPNNNIGNVLKFVKSASIVEKATEPYRDKNGILINPAFIKNDIESIERDAYEIKLPGQIVTRLYHQEEIENVIFVPYQSREEEMIEKVMFAIEHNPNLETLIALMVDDNKSFIQALRHMGIKSTIVERLKSLFNGRK